MQLSEWSPYVCLKWKPLSASFLLSYRVSCFTLFCRQSQNFLHIKVMVKTEVEQIVSFLTHLLPKQQRCCDYSYGRVHRCPFENIRTSIENNRDVYSSLQSLLWPLFILAHQTLLYHYLHFDQVVLWEKFLDLHSRRSTPK